MKISTLADLFILRLATLLCAAILCLSACYDSSSNDVTDNDGNVDDLESVIEYIKASNTWKMIPLAFPLPSQVTAIPLRWELPGKTVAPRGQSIRAILTITPARRTTRPPVAVRCMFSPDPAPHGTSKPTSRPQTLRQTIFLVVRCPVR